MEEKFVMNDKYSDEPNQWNYFNEWEGRKWHFFLLMDIKTYKPVVKLMIIAHKTLLHL